jgi:hypothetical protein
MSYILACCLLYRIETTTLIRVRDHMNFIKQLKSYESADIKRRVYGVIFVLFASALIGVSAAQELHQSAPTSFSIMDRE